MDPPNCSGGSFERNTKMLARFSSALARALDVSAATVLLFVSLGVAGATAVVGA